MPYLPLHGSVSWVPGKMPQGQTACATFSFFYDSLTIEPGGGVLAYLASCRDQGV
jgi:hypothetical protein